MQRARGVDGGAGLGLVVVARVYPPPRRRRGQVAHRVPGGRAPPEGRRVLEEAVYQSADDPKTLLIMHRFADAEAGNAFFSNPDHQALMGDLGVDASSVRIEVYQD
jgi:hypothetical protein